MHDVSGRPLITVAGGLLKVTESYFGDEQEKMLQKKFTDKIYKTERKLETGIRSN